MATCPVCQSENDADFGLAQCHSCGSAFFVQFDGSVEVASVASTSPSSASAPEPAVEADFKNDYSTVMSEGLLEDLGVSPTLAPADEEHQTENQKLTTEPGQPAAVSVTPAPEYSFKEVADFGNSEKSQAREGAFRFNITIMGIDSADIKTEVKDALSDSRFLWDVEAMLNDMQEGVLKINDLSAVKSALVVQRLKILPVDIKWEQYAIHQST